LEVGAEHRALEDFLRKRRILKLVDELVELDIKLVVGTTERDIGVDMVEAGHEIDDAGDTRIIREGAIKQDLQRGFADGIVLPSRSGQSRS
jgi:hypothetical protein